MTRIDTKPSTERPPTRYGVSYRETDPYWHEVAPRIRVFVSGVEMQQVVEYDCDTGTVLRNELDADGKAQLNDRRDEVLRETVRGVVTVEWKD